MALFPSETVRIRRTSATSRLVEAYGELDLSTGPRLEEVLGTVGVPPVAEIELDLGHVDLVDAYAMRCLQRAARKLAGAGCAVRISAVQPAVQAVLDLVGFDRVIPIAAGARTTGRARRDDLRPDLRPAARPA
jgi:anti-anti-sigma factor